MEENHNPREDLNDPVKKKQPANGMLIVAYNILGLVFYTLLFHLAGGSGIILDAFVLLFHVIICLAMALGEKSGTWLLSAVLVLIIGFSTCTML